MPIKNHKAVLRIGTSGIVVPGNKQSFPAAFQMKSRLNFYASIFNTLEVNSTFYKLPMRSTLERWAQDVPDNFRFTVKLWKEITHVAALNFNIDHLSDFMQTAHGLGIKSGCILIQFPGKITFDYYQQAEQLLYRLQDLDKENHWRKSIEFRSPTWYVGETYELLNELGATMVLHDMPKAKFFLVNDADNFVYVRFHGPEGDYRGSYSDGFLSEQSLKIKEWLSTGKDVYVYFNNTIGNAFQNALLLKKMCGV